MGRRTLRRLGPLAVALAVLAVCLVLPGCAQDDTEPEDGAATTEPGGASEDMTLTVSSQSYQSHGSIPARFAREGFVGGENVSPELSWSGVPDDAASLALVMVDRHPVANEWVHWMVVDIPADASGLSEGASGTDMPAGARELDNTFGEMGYGGPQPPAGTGEHEYEVIVYALDVPTLDVAQDASFSDFLEAVTAHSLSAGEYSGYLGD